MDASYKIQRGIHVHLIQFFMCPEFWVHIIFDVLHLHFFSCFSYCNFPPPDRILFRRPCDIYLPGYGQFSFIPIYPQTIPWSECPLKMHLLKEGSVSQKGETVFLFLFSRSRCQKQSGRSSLFPFFPFL